MSDPQLSSSARVALFLLNRSRKADGYSYLTNTELGEMIGVSADTVSDLAKELTAANLVRREARGRGSRRWKILALIGVLAIAGADDPAGASPATAHPFGSHITNAICGQGRRRRKGRRAEQNAALSGVEQHAA